MDDAQARAIEFADRWRLAFDEAITEDDARFISHKLKLLYHQMLKLKRMSPAPNEPSIARGTIAQDR